MCGFLGEGRGEFLGDLGNVMLALVVIWEGVVGGGGRSKSEFIYISSLMLMFTVVSTPTV